MQHGQEQAIIHHNNHFFSMPEQYFILLTDNTMQNYILVHNTANQWANFRVSQCANKNNVHFFDNSAQADECIEEMKVGGIIGSWSIYGGLHRYKICKLEERYIEGGEIDATKVSKIILSITAIEQYAQQAEAIAARQDSELSRHNEEMRQLSLQLDSLAAAAAFELYGQRIGDKVAYPSHIPNNPEEIGIILGFDFLDGKLNAVVQSGEKPNNFYPKRDIDVKNLNKCNT
jgi:hypothetical protein